MKHASEYFKSRHRHGTRYFWDPIETKEKKKEESQAIRILIVGKTWTKEVLGSRKKIAIYNNKLYLKNILEMIELIQGLVNFV